MSHCKVILYADRTIQKVEDIASQLEEGLCDVVDFVKNEDECSLAIAIGGDGTLINHGRTLAKHKIPLVGVNSGRLGFIAKFDAESLIRHRKVIFSHDRASMEVILLEVGVNDASPITAMNEAMVASGNPFRILELGLSINDIPAPTLRGDGVLVSTPIGSTAHNVSVGGPIVDPSANAFVLTPLAAHSLAVRPIVLDAHNKVSIEVLRANKGTSLVVDGQVHCTLNIGDTIRVQQSSQSLSIVLNPSVTYWNTLVDKLHWAAHPG